jgi:hypothetical protein
LDFCPRFIYRIGNTVIEKDIMFVRGEDTLLKICCRSISLPRRIHCKVSYRVSQYSFAHHRKQLPRPGN